MGFAHPGEDEFAGDEVVADLFVGVSLGVEEGGDRVVGAVGPGVDAGDLELVADAALDRQAAGVDVGASSSARCMSPSSRATATSWTATFVGPKAVQA